MTNLELPVELKKRLSQYLPEWLPNGNISGDDYRGKFGGGWTVAVNMKTGKWSDEETGRMGEDAIDLFAYINGISRLDSVKILMEKIEDETLPLPTASQVASLEQLGIQLTKGGKPVCNLDNALRAIEGHPTIKGSFWFDEFHQKFFTTRNSKTVREWTQSDTLDLTVFLQREIGLPGIGVDTAWSAIQCYGYAKKRSEPREWLESLRWDGQSRIDTFFHKYMNTPDEEYYKTVGQSFWLSMIARTMSPGCKVDTMVVLEGEQGTGKSTALDIIAGRWFAESSESPLSKDFFQVLQGRMIVEIAELDSFNRSEVQTIKRVITCRSDRYRPPYEKSPQDFNRTCILVGTTNESHYLRDSTGARRFLPVKVGEIKTDLLTQDRDQLFAEALFLYKAGKKWYDIFPKAETEAMRESRRMSDDWEAIIARLIAPLESVTIPDVGARIGYDERHLDRSVQLRIGKILRQLNWEAKSERIDGMVERVWRPKVPF